MTSFSPALLEPIEVLEGLPRAFSSPGWNDLFEVQSWSEKLSLSQYSKEHPKAKPWKRRGWERTRDRRKGMSWDRVGREKTGCHHLQWNTAQHRPLLQQLHIALLHMLTHVVRGNVQLHGLCKAQNIVALRKYHLVQRWQVTPHSSSIISSLGHRMDKVWCFSNFRASSVQQQELTVKGTRYFPQLCTSPKKKLNN